jgi:hypothetical protein
LRSLFTDFYAAHVENGRYDFVRPFCRRHGDASQFSGKQVRCNAD